MGRDCGNGGVFPRRPTQAQRNFTDPDSHILNGADGWIQGYNAQAAVDGDHQMIVAIGVSNRPSDACTCCHSHWTSATRLLERIQANRGQIPIALIADTGYCSTANLKAFEEKGLEAYISTSPEQHGQRFRPSRGRVPRDLDARLA